MGPPRQWPVPICFFETKPNIETKPRNLTPTPYTNPFNPMTWGRSDNGRYPKLNHVT